MREATGGLLLLDLVVTILFVFIFFIASFMQYTRVYKIKGNVINAIERAEGGVKSETEFTRVLSAAGYGGPYEFCKYTNTSRGTYYSLTLYTQFVILPRYFSIKVPISGNSRTVDTGIFFDQDQDVFKGPHASCDGNVCCLKIE